MSNSSTATPSTSTSSPAAYALSVSLHDVSVGASAKQQAYFIKIYNVNVKIIDEYIRHCNSTFNKIPSIDSYRNGLQTCVFSGISIVGEITTIDAPLDSILHDVFGLFSKVASIIFNAVSTPIAKSIDAIEECDNSATSILNVCNTLETTLVVDDSRDEMKMIQVETAEAERIAEWIEPPVKHSVADTIVDDTAVAQHNNKKWLKCYSPDDKSFYYYNNITLDTQWEAPEGSDVEIIDDEWSVALAAADADTDDCDNNKYAYNDDAYASEVSSLPSSSYASPEVKLIGGAFFGHDFDDFQGITTSEEAPSNGDTTADVAGSVASSGMYTDYNPSAPFATEKFSHIIATPAEYAGPIVYAIPIEDLHINSNSNNNYINSSGNYIDNEDNCCDECDNDGYEYNDNSNHSHQSSLADDDETLKRLVEMGFPLHVAKTALIDNYNDVPAAVSSIVNNYYGEGGEDISSTARGSSASKKNSAVSANDSASRTRPVRLFGRTSRSEVNANDAANSHNNNNTSNVIRPTINLFGSQSLPPPPPSSDFSRHRTVTRASTDAATSSNQSRPVLSITKRLAQGLRAATKIKSMPSTDV